MLEAVIMEMENQIERNQSLVIRGRVKGTAGITERHVKIETDNCKKLVQENASKTKSATI